VRGTLFFVLCIAIAIVRRVMRYSVKAVKHRRGYSAFSGCSSKFLAEFPEW
jgi:hypothetical protein